MKNGLMLAVFMLLTFLAGDVFGQEPIRIDRPKEGATVDVQIEVGGVASPGATVEVWVDRVFIADTIAEPDGWYVARIRRPPSATAKSRIFVHELNSEGQRTSSAVVRVVWSENSVPPEESLPRETVSDPVEDPSSPPVEGAAPVHQAESVAGPEPRTTRGTRIALEYLLSIAGGLTGAVVGLVFASPLGEPDSAARAGANLLLGSIGGGLGAAGAVYGVGYALQGNGSFMWTAVGGLGGAFLVSIVGLASDAGGGGAGLLLVPVGLAAFGLPVLAFELTSDVSRFAPTPTVTPAVGTNIDGGATFGFRLSW